MGINSQFGKTNIFVKHESGAINDKVHTEEIIETFVKHIISKEIILIARLFKITLDS